MWQYFQSSKRLFFKLSLLSLIQSYQKIHNILFHTISLKLLNLQFLCFAFFLNNLKDLIRLKNLSRKFWEKVHSEIQIRGRLIEKISRCFYAFFSEIWLHFNNLLLNKTVHSDIQLRSSFWWNYWICIQHKLWIFKQVDLTSREEDD